MVVSLCDVARARFRGARLAGAVLGVLAFTYFVFYPHDLASILNPLEKILALSNAVAPWLYGVIAVAILCWTALRIWGNRPARETKRDVPPI